MQLTKRHTTLIYLALPLFSLAGIGYLLALPWDGVIAQSIYIDENALLVGMALPDMMQQDKQAMQASEAALQQHSDSKPWLQALFRRMGLETSEYCYKHTKQHSSIPSTCITSAILRAPKGDGKESMVLVMEYQPNKTASEGSMPSGLSMVTSIANILLRAKWLQKDVIFVAVPNHSGKRHAVEAFGVWVKEYHASQYIVGYSEAFPRGGVIIAALVVDIPKGIKYNRLSIMPVGQYGLLPNLDLVSVSARLMRQHGIPFSVCETELTPRVLRSTSTEFLPDLLGDYHKVYSVVSSSKQCVVRLVTMAIFSIIILIP